MLWQHRCILCHANKATWNWNWETDRERERDRESDRERAGERDIIIIIFFIQDTHKWSIAQYKNIAKYKQIQDKTHTIRNVYNSQSPTIHKKSVQKLAYRLKHQQFHNLEVNLTALNAGFTSVAMMLLYDSVSLHIHLYMRFLSTAGQVNTLTLTNIWLALLHRGILSSSLMPSLYATLSFCILLFL